MAKGVKTGGRTKGTANKTTAEIRERFQNLVSNNLTQLDSDIKSLEPLQRLKMIIELSKFVVPTLKATELTTPTDNEINVVTIKFADKEIDFLQNDLSSIELAYCLTCHLTQGSGFKNVIVLIDNTHYKLLDRCMLYTAITRAKTKCALIAETSAFQRCLKIQASQRNTWLSLLYNNV